MGNRKQTTIFGMHSGSFSMDAGCRDHVCMLLPCFTMRCGDDRFVSMLPCKKKKSL